MQISWSRTATGGGSGADYIVTDQASLNTAMAAVTSGEIVEFAGTWTDIVATVPTGSYSGVTLRGASGHNVKNLTLNGVTNLTLDDINFEYDNSAGSDNNDSTAFAFLTLAGTTHSNTVQNCTFDGYPTASDGSQQTEAEMNKRWTGIRAGTGTFTGGTGLTVTNCTFYRMYDAMSVNNCVQNVNNNHFEQIYVDAIIGLCNNLTGIPNAWVIDQNTATKFEGINKRRYTVSSISGGNPAVDDIYTVGNTVIKVVSFDAANSYVYGAYNNYVIPTAGQTLTTSGGKSFTISSVASSSVYDGKHGDFCQPIKNTGSGNVSLTVTRNHVYRSTAYVLDDFGQEQNVQGLLAQNNGGSIVWSPIDVRWNIIAGGQSIGIKIIGAANGHISYNGVVWQEYQGATRSRFELGSVASSVTVTKNVGDETQSTSNWYNDQGGNTFTDTGNLYVDGDDGSQDTAYAAWDTYPQTLANLAPAVGGIIDTNSAGPLTTTGAFRG